MDVSCYPTPFKPKALRICEAFAWGVEAAGGTARVCRDLPRSLQPGAAVFYGVTADTEHLWHQARAEGRDWYYIDNSYFDATRGTYYRITRNAIQFRGEPWAGSDGCRWAALGLQIRPPRSDGEHIVVCLQSPSFMRVIAGLTPDAWWSSIAPALKATGRPIRVRGWSANKSRQMDTLASDLEGAWALVTYNSAAAIEAVLQGVPAYCTGPSALGAVASATIGSALPSKNRILYRMKILADHQWSIDEIRRGNAWRALSA